MGLKRAIFTVLIGDYDRLNIAPSQNGWDCILITDQKIANSKGWKIIQVPVSVTPRLDSRMYKILSHKYLAKYSLICYIDANYKIISQLPNRPIRFLHLKRRFVHEEIEAIKSLNKENLPSLDTFAKYCNDVKFKDNFGLYQNGFFIREHNEIENKLHELWWMFTNTLTTRDQLTLPLAFYMSQIPMFNFIFSSNQKKYFKKTGNHK